MIIVIDGYNILKQVFPGIKGRMDEQRNHFIRQLSYYKHKKAGDIKDILVVFDAGPFNHATREVKGGIVVVYSGQKLSADDWIIDYVSRHNNEDLLIVTMDRKLIEACGKCGISALGSCDFYTLLQNCILEDIQHAHKKSEPISDFEKYESIDLDDDATPVDKQALDMLIEQASLTISKDLHEDEKPQKTKSKSSSFKLSKKEKLAFKKIKKLH